MTEAEMKLLLSKQQQLQNAKGQQVTQLQVPAQSNLAAQLLAGSIHVQPHSGAGGGQVATLVKTVSASGSSGVAVVGTSGQSSVTIPVANVNLPQVKAALARSGVTPSAQMQLALRQQLIQQQRKPVTTIAGTQQKVTLGQVGAKGVPAQLIVSSSGAVSAAAAGQKQLPQQAVTVQQFQQIVKSVQQPGVSAASGSLPQQIVSHSQQQQLIPHAVFSKQAVVSTFAGAAGTVTGIITTVGGTTTTQTSTVQARVIPVSSTSSAGGRVQQIQVVAATPTQVQVTISAVSNSFFSNTFLS
jgi:hypothetical protein